MDIIKNKAEYDKVLANNKSVFVDFSLTGVDHVRW